MGGPQGSVLGASGLRVFEDVKRDLLRYGPSGGAYRNALLSHGAWATVGYRFARFAVTAPIHPIFGWPLRFLAAVVQLVVRTLTNIDLSSASQVGPGLYMPHTGYVVVGAGVILGENVNLTPGVVLGHSLGGEHSSTGVPRLGDRVYVGPGAKLIGRIDVGDDALIGTGAVVTSSLPPRAVAVGNPARVIAHTGSFEVVRYRGMDSDAARSRSQAEVSR